MHNPCHYAHRQQDDSQDNLDHVDSSLDEAALMLEVSLVQHYLSFVACINHKAYYKMSILKNSASEKDVFFPHCHGLCSLKLDLSAEVMEVLVWSLHFHTGSQSRILLRVYVRNVFYTIF